MAFGARTDSANDAFKRARAKGDHYVTRVNTGGLDVERHTDFLNKAYADGFRLFAIFEQKGNTVMVFEQMAA